MEMVHVINQDGKAVPVKIVSGSSAGVIAGKDIDTDAQVSEVSFEMDDNGYPVLRVIDAAPYAYNSVEDALDVNIKQRTMPLERRSYDVTVEAGTTRTFAELDVSAFESLSWGVTVDASSDFKLVSILTDNESGAVLHRLDRNDPPYRETFTSSSNGLTKKIEMQTTGVKLAIINDDTVSHTYTAYVYMRRG